MTNLYTKTEYSFLQSNIRIDQLVKKAKELGYSSLGIADDNLHGAFKFYTRCIEEGIKPIIGLEIVVSEFNYLIYAKNTLGYQELLKLSSIKELEGTVSWSQFETKDLLVVLKGDILDYEFDSLTGIDYVFGVELDDLELELNFAPKVVEKAKELSKDYIVLSKTKYIESKDYKYVLALEAIESGNELSMDSYSVGSSYLHSEEEITRIFSEYPGILEKTIEIVSEFSVEISYGGYQLPKYPTEHDAKDYLEALCTKGLKKRLNGDYTDLDSYFERLKMELRIIDEMGFNDYFLIVWDFVNFAKRRDILVGPGRGSAAGSLVSYCLGITNADPLEYDLPFERFLNPERVSMPDIDMDFPDDKRDEVIEYVRDKYSSDNVASIVTFGTFAGRSAVRDVAKIIGLRTEYLDEVLKHIPVNASNLKKLIQGKELRDLRTNFREIEQLLDYAANIEGLPRHTSTHAAGIIITDKPMTEYTALQKGLGNIYQSQFEQKDLEKLGLLKIDFLGLGNLKILKRTCDLIEQYEGKKINLYNIEYNDQEVFDLLTKGDTDGVFQLESRGVRDVLRKLKVKDFEDVIATLALYRPGPMENIPTYIKNKHSGNISYVHPDLEPILKKTYGVIVYQEQIIMIANQFAGYSLGEADLLRRAVSKKDHKTLQDERIRFIAKCKEQSYSEEVANRIYDYIVKFANYGFNRCHSTPYAMISYQCAYLKVKYPKYFMAVLLSHSVGSEKSTEKYIRECRKLAIKIVPPTVNESLNAYKVLKDSVQLPFISIKNLGNSTARKLIEERENGVFKDYLDFVGRTKGILNQSVIEKLINASALDEFGIPKKVMIDKYQDAIKFLDYGQLIDNITFDFGELTEYTVNELIDNERAALGFNIKYNFMDRYRETIIKNKLDTLSDLEYKNTIKFIARINKVKVIKTKNGKEMAFVTIEDESRVVDSVIFPQQFSQYGKMLMRGEVCLFQAKLEHNDRSSLIVNKVGKL